MKKTRALIPAAFAITLGASVTPGPAEAQQQGMQGARPGMALFEERAPQIGEPLPDITIVDDTGSPVNIRDIPGENYTVLVLGCLT